MLGYCAQSHRCPEGTARIERIVASFLSRRATLLGEPKWTHDNSHRNILSIARLRLIVKRKYAECTGAARLFSKGSRLHSASW